MLVVSTTIRLTIYARRRDTSCSSWGPTVSSALRCCWRLPSGSWAAQPAVLLVRLCVRTRVFGPEPAVPQTGLLVSVHRHYGLGWCSLEPCLASAGLSSAPTGTWQRLRRHWLMVSSCGRAIVVLVTVAGLSAAGILVPCMATAQSRSELEYRKSRIEAQRAATIQKLKTVKAEQLTARNRLVVNGACDCGTRTEPDAEWKLRALGRRYVWQLERYRTRRRPPATAKSSSNASCSRSAGTPAYMEVLLRATDFSDCDARPSTSVWRPKTRGWLSAARVPPLREARARSCAARRRSTECAHRRARPGQRSH